jgi:transposase-like protein
MIYNESTVSSKHILQPLATVSQIENYTEKVRRGQNPCGLPPCSRCQVKSDDFSRHEKRRRKFFVSVEQIVQVVIGMLCRWKCPGCGKTFTDYPEFALPYKRYTLPTIMSFTHRYVNDEPMTYRKLVKEEALGYENSATGDINERQLAHSTIFRWITTLGSFPKIIRKGQDLINQANPASTICRDLAGLAVSIKKYLSIERKKLLRDCRQILHLEVFYQLTFETSIFPKLATACGFS